MDNKLETVVNSNVPLEARIELYNSIAEEGGWECLTGTSDDEVAMAVMKALGVLFTWVVLVKFKFDENEQIRPLGIKPGHHIYYKCGPTKVKVFL